MPAARRGFEHALLRALRSAPLPPQPVLIVAASGGVDSTALLLGVVALSRRALRGARVVACHVDHGLRAAAERLAEQALLQELCDRIGVDLVVQRAVIPARHAASLEARARAARYDALCEAAHTRAACAVLAGHTADDQVETVLLRLLRGTGVRGLRGMDMLSRPWGVSGPLLLRPLLTRSRDQTTAYCRARGAAWSEDSSNASREFLRNRVRHELMPLLHDLWPGAGGGVLRLAEQASEITAWLDAEVAALEADLLRRDGERMMLMRPPAGTPYVIERQLVGATLAGLLGGAGAPSQRHVAGVHALLHGGRGRELSIKRGWFAVAESVGVLFERRTGGLV